VVSIDVRHTGVLRSISVSIVFDCGTGAWVKSTWTTWTGFEGAIGRTALRLREVVAFEVVGFEVGVGI